MIVVWISHKNRRARRAAFARAKKAGAQLLVLRAEGDVDTQTNRLIVYLLNPDPHNLASLLEHGDVPPQLLNYMTGIKATPVERSTPEAFNAQDDGKPDAGADSECLEAALKSVQHQPNGERVLQIITRNLLTHSVEDQQLELSLIAGLAPGKDSPVDHLVVSWPDGVTPTPAQVEELIDLLLKIWRMERHQLFAAVHGDTQHVHVHIAVNRVDPFTGERIAFGADDAWAMDTLHQSIAVAAHRFGWPTAENARYRADGTGCHDSASGVQVLNANDEPCASRTDWRRINKIRQREARDQAISTEARRYELRTGYRSLERIAREHLAEVISEAVTWGGLHAELADRGVEYVLAPGGKGAHLTFEGRTIAASRAWGGASLDKLSRQIGCSFEPRASDVPVAPFVEQEYPGLRDTVLRRQKLIAMRTQSRFEDSVTADVSDSIAATHSAARDAIDAKCWIGHRDELNATRSATSKPFRIAREAVAIQKKRKLRIRKLRRRLLKLCEWREPFTEITDGNSPAGFLIGPDCGPGRKGEDIGPQFERNDVEAGREYRRNGQLVFVDRTTIIELHAPRDKDAMRAALRLAHAKWGSVQATGSSELLSMLVDLALEENVAITNPALQPIIAARRQARADIEQQRRIVEAATPSAADPIKSVDAPALPPIKFCVVLPAEYPAPFHEWDRRDRSGDGGRDVLAGIIANDPKMLEALEELRVQGYPQAARIKADVSRLTRAAAGNEVGRAPSTPPVGMRLAPPIARAPVPSLPEIAEAQADRERADWSKLIAVLTKATLSRTAWDSSPFRDNANAVLEDVVTRPQAYCSIDDPQGVRMVNGSPSGRSDALAVLTFNRDFMFRAHSALRQAQAYRGAGRFSYQFNVPLSVNRRSDADFLARAATDTLIPELVGRRPRINNERGTYWFADVQLTVDMGDEAVGMLTDAGQSQLKAAFLVQEIERHDLLSAISEGKALIVTVADGRGGIVNRLADPNVEFNRSLSHFATDASFATDAALAAATPCPPPIESRRHVLLRAYRAAVDESDNSTALALCRMIARDAERDKIVRQIGSEDVKRLSGFRTHEDELRRMCWAAQPRRSKKKAKGKGSPGRAMSQRES